MAYVEIPFQKTLITAQGQSLYLHRSPWFTFPRSFCNQVTIPGILALSCRDTSQCLPWRLLTIQLLRCQGTDNEHYLLAAYVTLVMNQIKMHDAWDVFVFSWWFPFTTTLCTVSDYFFKGNFDEVWIESWISSRRLSQACTFVSTSTHKYNLSKVWKKSGAMMD